MFRGFSKELKHKSEAGAADLVEALEIGVAAAYKAVMKPTEGTILTVARVAAEKSRTALTDTMEPLEIWDRSSNMPRRRWPRGAAAGAEKRPV